MKSCIKKFKIVYILTRADDIGGAQIHVRDLATELHKSGHEVSVISGSAGPLSNQLMEHEVPFHSVPSLRRGVNPWHDFAAFLKIKSLLTELKPNLISTHCSKAGWLGRAAAIMLGIPVIYTPHGWKFDKVGGVFQRHLYSTAERLAASFSDRIVTVSDHCRRFAVDEGIVKPEKTVCIHNGIKDGAGARDRPLARAEPPRLVMTARFAEPKDHASLLKALAKLREREWTLDLIGEGPKKPQVIALARSLGIADRINFLGLRNDVMEVLLQSDVFLLITKWEGFPRTILEAMSARLPVIASDVGGVSESVIDQKTGFLVSPGDQCALIEKLRLLIGNVELRRALGNVGRKVYEQKFCFQVMFNHTIALYREILAERGKCAPVFGHKFGTFKRLLR